MNEKRYRREFAEMAAILTCHGIAPGDIARLLGVKNDQLEHWKNRHREFAAALNETNTENRAENALLKRALGFQINESTAEELIDKKSGEILEVLKRKTITKEVPPDVRALLFYLQNRHPERWNNSGNPTAYVPELAEEDKEL